jgi:acyl dehydratase
MSSDLTQAPSVNGNSPHATEDDRKPGFYNADVVLDRPFDEMVQGDRFASRKRTITEGDLVNFACLTGDWRPAHTDRVFAETSELGGRIAHGTLLLAIAIGLVPNTYVVALRRLKRVVFKKPVYIGDTIHVRGKVHRLKDFSDELGMVTALWRLVNQKGDVCMTMEFEMLWQREWF